MNEPKFEMKDRLRQALNMRDMKPIELSEKTGISKSTISQYMSGYAKPKDDKLYLISKALGVKEAWLLGYETSMERNPNQGRDEALLIKKYNQLDKGHQEIVLKMIDEFIEYQSKYNPNK